MTPQIHEAIGIVVEYLDEFHPKGGNARLISDQVTAAIAYIENGIELYQALKWAFPGLHLPNTIRARIYKATTTPATRLLSLETLKVAIHDNVENEIAAEALCDLAECLLIEPMCDLVRVNDILLRIMVLTERNQSWHMAAAYALGDIFVMPPELVVKLKRANTSQSLGKTAMAGSVRVVALPLTTPYGQNEHEPLSSESMPTEVIAALEKFMRRIVLLLTTGNKRPHRITIIATDPDRQKARCAGLSLIVGPTGAVSVQRESFKDTQPTQ
jgi:hypothetical protein